MCNTFHSLLYWYHYIIPHHITYHYTIPLCHYDHYHNDKDRKLFTCFGKFLKSRHWIWCLCLDSYFKLFHKFYLHKCVKKCFRTVLFYLVLSTSGELLSKACRDLLLVCAQTHSFTVYRKFSSVRGYTIFRLSTKRTDGSHMKWTYRKHFI